MNGCRLRFVCSGLWFGRLLGDQSCDLGAGWLFDGSCSPLRGYAVPRIISFAALRQDLRLLDPLFPIDAAGNAEQLADTFNVCGAPGRNVLEAIDAVRLQPLLDIGVDGANALKIVAAFDRLPHHRLGRGYRHRGSRLFRVRRVLSVELFIIRVDGIIKRRINVVFDFLAGNFFRFFDRFLDDAHRTLMAGRTVE